MISDDREYYNIWIFDVKLITMHFYFGMFGYNAHVTTRRQQLLVRYNNNMIALNGERRDTHTQQLSLVELYTSKILLSTSWVYVYRICILLLLKLFKTMLTKLMCARFDGVVSKSKHNSTCIFSIFHTLSSSLVVLSRKV